MPSDHASDADPSRSGPATTRPTVELQAPDISGWRHGNTGVEHVHLFDSGRPGPTVMLQALTHGNEICGALALCHLFGQGLQPQRGRLILAFANVAAYARFDPADPHPSRYVDEDLNRVWADEVLFGPRDSAELRRARELQPFVDAADLLLDIHSMSEACRPLMVCGQSEKNAAYAVALGVPGDLLIDTGHPAGLRLIERGGFADATSPKRALLIECGQHWERSAETVAIDTALRFLALTGVVDSAWAAARLRSTPPARQRLVRVTEAVVARSMDFHFLVPMVGLSVVPLAGTPIARDGDHVWRAPCDDTVLVMPSLSHLLPGNTQARLGRFEDTADLAAGPAVG
jgi:predicted deacylase